MKFKLLAMILALSVVSSAQTATQTVPTPEQKQSATSEDKKDATACQKMMAGKEGSCCMHHDMAAKDGKDAMACCGGKDKKACRKMMKTSKNKMAAMCGDGKCCGKDAKDCCKHRDKEMAMACCTGTQCGNHENGEEMK
jgi:hypothetical protein